MKEKIDKEKIHEAAVHKQQELIRNFEERVQEMKADVYGHDQTASQSENRQAGKIEVLSRLESELGFAQAEMGFLRSIQPTRKCDKAEPGCIVVTNQRIFYVAVSSEVMEIEGQQVFGISPRAPLYQVMAGKTAGEQFAFHETEYEIEAIY